MGTPGMVGLEEVDRHREHQYRYLSAVDIVNGGSSSDVVGDVAGVEDGVVEVWGEDEDDDDKVADEVSVKKDDMVDEDGDCEALVVFENLRIKCALCAALAFPTGMFR
ncbi:hypothetical protein GQX73_g10359 [Xylaria multiplex]|uniref:Uncharacterized protein n=1 Tax=Xylaria multiplex TaxID=323545 RepID=A0A7C8IJL9_9PEZI|nr:hypothetical protein GQX73_g10359 [Xylaria multiplex]